MLIHLVHVILTLYQVGRDLGEELMNHMLAFSLCIKSLPPWRANLEDKLCELILS